VKGDKKKGALLLALGDPEGGGDEELDGEDEGLDLGEEMGMTAAEDAIAAMKKGDASALHDALKRHYESCVMAGPGSEGSEADEDIEDEEY
jgi:hypothetical protein